MTDADAVRHFARLRRRLPRNVLKTDGSQKWAVVLGLASALLAGVVAGVRYASGEGGVSIRGRAGVLISRAAGARVVGDSGRPFPMDMDSVSHTLRIAADDATIDVLADALAAAGID